VESSPNSRRALKWSLVTLAAVLVVLGLLVAALALVDADHLRAPLTHFIAAHTGRQIRIDGPMKAHLLSLHPSLIAERVTIGNPPWTAPGNIAEIAKLTVVFDLPLFSHPFAIRRLVMDGANLHLLRDEAGHANWRWKAPGILPGEGPPIIHSMSVPAARVALDDERHHLLFAGTVSAEGVPGPAQTEPLRITGKGHLNGRDVTLTIDGDPLATVTRDEPYHFNLDERSSGSHVTGHGSLSHPFDFRMLDETFEATGEDLQDLYFLAGVRLPNTGPYRLSGNLSLRDTRFTLSDLHVTFGQSDVSGTLTGKLMANGRSHLDVDLHSELLRLADFGLRAAGRASEPPSTKPLVLPDTPIRLEGIRRSDSVVNFRARQVDAGHLSFRTVAGKMVIDQGSVTVPQLSASLADDPSGDQPSGKITARIEFDAKPDRPAANVHLSIVNFQLAQLSSKDPAQPPIDGLLQGRLDLKGRGLSIHDLAASANGTVTATLPQGAMRDSLAELSGIDFRGLGLTLTKNKKDTPIRCAVASFQARNGTLTAQTLIIDTDPVLITGSGSIQLGAETLDLRIEGFPKHLRMFRLHAPVAVHGTLAHPSVGIEGSHKSLELVDPGRAKDADCATLLAEAKTSGARASADDAPAGHEPSSR
jgi:AsmA family protein